MKLAQSEFLNDKRTGTLSENDIERFKNQIKKYKRIVEYKDKQPFTKWAVGY